MGMRNRVERFFRYLNVVFNHTMSTILKPINNILSGHEGREVSKKRLSRHYP
jgi:hypothetical protein